MSDFDKFHDSFDTQLGSVPYADPSIYSRHVSTREGRIKSIKNLTYDTYEMIVECEERSLTISSGGQYAILQASSFDKPRAFSFARDPESEKPGEHTFFIRVVEGGLFSSWLIEKDRVGEKLTISLPLGKFGLDSSERPMLCIAGGSGMSAMFSILEEAKNKQIERDAHFFYGARTQNDLYMIDEIHEIINGWHPQRKLHFIPVLSEEPEDSDWDGATGLVTACVKEKYIDTGKIKPTQSIAYFCGPPPMIDAGIEVLKEAGMEAEDILYDKFEDTSSPAPVIDNTLCILCDQCLMVKPINCIHEITQLSSNSDGVTFETIKPAESSSLYYNSLFIDEKVCIRCYACVDVCPTNAISPTYDKVPKTLRRIDI